MSPRALLSVSDKTGVARFAEALHDLGFELVSSGGTATEIEQAGVPVTTVDVGHRIARDARSPCRHAAPEGARWHPRRSRQGGAPGRSRGAGHRAVRPRGGEPLPVSRAPRHRDDRHRRSDHGAGRGQEPRVGRRRHEPGAIRRGPRRAARARRHAHRRRHAGTSRSRRSRIPPPTTLRSCAGCNATSNCHAISWSRSRRRATSSATARTLTRRRPATASPTGRAGGTECNSTAGSRSRTSTSTTPRRRGSSSTTSATRRPAPSSSTPTRAVWRSPTTWRPRTSARSRPTSSRPSAGSWR